MKLNDMTRCRGIEQEDELVEHIRSGCNDAIDLLTIESIHFGRSMIIEELPEERLSERHHHLFRTNWLVDLLGVMLSLGGGRIKAFWLFQFRGLVAVFRG